MNRTTESCLRRTFSLKSSRLYSSDLSKATSYKAKARELKAKAKATAGRHTATVLCQNKTSDVIYLLQGITANNDKNMITAITSAIILYLLLE